MTNPTSFPKEQIQVLLLENIHPNAVRALTAEGYQVTALDHALNEAELVKQIANVHLLGIRSGAKVTARVIAAAPHLLAVGAFCIGVNQIDLPAAARAGVAVFNAPYSNTRSVVELALGEMIMLLRRTFTRSADTHAGIWHKTAEGSHEARGKTLGIVGYGNIGAQLGVLAEAMGMKVVYYDKAAKLSVGNAQPLPSLSDVWATADIITVHVDGRPDNAGLIGAAEFAAMKPGAIFLNLSRGHVVDQTALAAALRRGHLAGAAVDVYPNEPDRGGRISSPLQQLPNVILTPHVGGSTQEAQAAIGQFVADTFINFVNTGGTNLCLNLPNIQLPAQANHHRLLHMHRNVPGVLAKMNAILAGSGANIAGQYLGTSGDIGYCITDIDHAYSRQVRSKLAALPETIKLRLLY